MNERLLVLVRAIPEKRKKGSYVVCVAGITDKGEWRRIYPFEFQPFFKKPNFRKRQWIDVQVELPRKDKRTESRKLIKLNSIGSTENEIGTAKKLEKHLSSSINELQTKGLSLGAIKPKPDTLDLEIKINNTKLLDEQTYFSAWQKQGIQVREKVKMPVEISYVFQCPGECFCKNKPHKLRIIDWEINELIRNVVKSTQNKKEIESELRQKLIDFMKKRELYFILGTHFKFKTWMIIGLIYPSKESALQTTLF